MLKQISVMTDEQPQAAAPNLEAIGPVLFQEVLETFAEPELVRRQQAGEWPENAPVYRFQVLLHHDRQLEVRFNEEVGGTAQAVATRTIEKGEEVTVEDIGGITAYELPPEDQNVPHITAFLHRDGWSVAFDFNYRHPRRYEYLERGGEFAATARDALAAGRLGVALDNAFSATELLAKAELLSSHPTIDDALASRSHEGVAIPYSLWARLENTDRRFVRLLNRLRELRSAARYLGKQLSLKPGEPADLFVALADMEEHVQRAVDGEPISQPPHGFNVIATRDLKAGQIVKREDFTLLPHKK
jgi:hypothetical protein